MNRQGEEGIEWTDYTWNVGTGCAKNPHCSYCYAKKIAIRLYGHFNPIFFPQRLSEPYKVKKPSKIFADSMWEPWGGGFRKTQIASVLQVCYDCYWHIFQWLTKFPQNLKGYDFPPNCWVGCSVDSLERVKTIKYLRRCNAEIKFISIEPMLEPVRLTGYEWLDWVIIGGKTGKQPFYPPKEWIQSIISWCRLWGIPIFVKDNSGLKDPPREFPGESKTERKTLADYLT